MKLSVLIVLITSFQCIAFSGAGQEKISLDLKGVTIENVLKTIESQGKYNFVYRSDILPQKAVINVYAKDATIDYVMDKVLQNTDISYKKTAPYLITLIKNNAAQPDFLPSWVLNGVVVNSKDEPVAGATISIIGTNKGTSTDLDGKFIIEVETASDSIIISAIGYRTLTVAAGIVKERTFRLEEDLEGQRLNEVVVVGFGTQRKREMVSSVETITAEELKTPSSNLTTALAGRLSGIIAYQRSGEPGADNADFFIRGITTFGVKRDPLILIDGVELSTRELARLQPYDIATFSILKDATATAVYGARGANGVILVTTKKGKEGKAKLNLNVENSISMPTTNIELADPVTYMKMGNEARLTRNPLSGIIYSQEKIEKTGQAGSNPYIFPANDWREQLFNDYTNNQRYYLNISGGGGVARYFVSGALTNDNGLLKVDQRNNFNSNINLKTYSLRSNVDVDLTPSTLLTVRLHGNFDDYHGPIYTGTQMYNRVMHANPVLFPAYYPTDSVHQFVNHILFGNYENGQYINPYADLVRGYMDYSRSIMLAQLEVKQDLNAIAKGLTWRTMMNTNRSSYFSVSRQYNPYYYSIGGYDPFANSYSLSLINAKATSGTTAGTEYLNWASGPRDVATFFYLESALNYDRIFNDKHSLSGLLVYLMNQRLVAGRDPDNNNIVINSLERSLPHRNMGVAGRLAYGFDNRYFAQFDFGYNGSERFYQDKRFGFFPSFGLAWNVSNESFFDNLRDVVDVLKFRATYGFIGSDAIGNPGDRFFYLSNVNMDEDWWFRGIQFGTLQNPYPISGISVYRYGNNNITWESSRQTNLGMDLSLFRQLNLKVDLYKQYRKNILIGRASIPETMGLQATQMASMGEASSKGVDISLDYKHNFGNDFTLSMLGNFTYATSRYEKLDEPFYDEAYRYRVGQPINQVYGLIAERLFIDDNEAANAPFQGFNGISQGGDIKYLDVNRDGIITQADMVPVGFPTVPEITYGFGFSATYKGLDFSSFFQGLARESFWIDPVATAPFVNQTQVLKAYANSYWSEDNKDVYAIWPRLSSYINSNNTITNTWFMRNGTFLRLKQIELGYTFPQRLTNRFKASNLRIYFNGTNLLTWSQFKLWDVEMGGNGLGYPIQKVYNIGINIGFN